MFHKKKITKISSIILASTFLLAGCQSNEEVKGEEVKELENTKKSSEPTNVQDKLMDVQDYSLEGKKFTLEHKPAFTDDHFIIKRYEEDGLIIYESTIISYVEQKNINDGEYEIIVFPEYNGTLPQRFVLNEQQYNKIDRGEFGELKITQFFNDKGVLVGKKKEFIGNNMIDPEFDLLTDGKSNLEVDETQIPVNDEIVAVNEKLYRVDQGRRDYKYENRDEEEEFVETKAVLGYIGGTIKYKNADGTTTYEIEVNYDNEDGEESTIIFSDKQFFEKKLNRNLLETSIIEEGDNVYIIVHTTFNNYTGRLGDRVDLIN